jgi:hypothetical protein
MALLRLQNEANCLTLQPTKQSLKHQPSSKPQSELPLPRERFSPGVEMTRSQTPAEPALSNRNIEICQWVMPGNDVLISSVESGLAKASGPR